MLHVKGEDMDARVSHPLDSVKRIYKASLASVSPCKLVREALRFDNLRGYLHAGLKSYKIDHNVIVVGFGKAVPAMLEGVKSVLGPHIIRGIVSVPYNSMQSQGRFPVRICEGGKDNLPDLQSVENTKTIIKELQTSDSNNLVVVLISGGGSALLCCPADGVTLDEKVRLTRLVAGAGASIEELNKCRIMLSQVKGGKLAQLAYPAKVLALILSDIIDSPLELIASGPTIPVDLINVQRDVLSIIDKYQLRTHLSCAMLTSLEASLPQRSAIVPTDTQNILIGDNTVAALAAKQHAESIGYNTLLLSTSIAGESRMVGGMFAQLAVELVLKVLKSGDPKADVPVQSLQLLDDARRYNSELDIFLTSCVLPVCIIGAGETTVTLKGSGKGGRNQELVLGFALELQKLVPYQFQFMKGAIENVVFCSLGTDGQDGPTDAAGALVVGTDVMKWDRGEIQRALENNDSYNFLEGHKECLIKTGLTGTNVMDIQILTIEKFM